MNDLKLKKANEEKIAKEQLEAAQAFAKELETKEVTVLASSTFTFSFPVTLG